MTESDSLPESSSVPNAPITSDDLIKEPMENVIDWVLANPGQDPPEPWQYHFGPKGTITHPRVVESSGGGACPEQHWGTLDDGRVFYLRYRHGQARLHVGPPGTPLNDMPLSNPEWDKEAFDRAIREDTLYDGPPYFAPPIGYVDVTDEDYGWFEDQEERDRVFAQLLEQIDDTSN